MTLKKLYCILLVCYFLCDIGKAQLISDYCQSKPDSSFLSISFVEPSLSLRESGKIPVVIHLLWKNNSDSLTDSQILSQIDVLNEDFNASNYDLINVPNIFKGLIGNPGISFCLATINPEGELQNGILRKHVDIDNIGEAISTDNRPAIKYEILGGSDAWDPERYLNIWLGHRTLTLGESTFPFHLIPEEEGIVIDPRYFGRRGNKHKPFHLGRVATHEVGHYLGLLHPWGLDIGCDTNDDLISDTPFQSGPYFGCPEFPQTSCNSADMYMNFMNFTDDDCLNFFTKEQSGFMNNILSTVRPDLMSSSRCISFTPTSQKLEDKVKFALYAYSIELIFQHSDDKEYLIRIFDIKGNLVVSNRIHSKFFHRINTEYFRTGVYIIQILNSKEMFAKRVIIVN